MQKKLHLIMQGKGGVGKTFAAVVLSQYLKSLGKDIICVDTDPVNRAFAGYAALNVVATELVAGTKILPAKFDELILDGIHHAISRAGHQVTHRPARKRPRCSFQ